MPEFLYADPFPSVEKDCAPYRQLTNEHVAVATVDGQEVLKVEFFPCS